MKTVGGAKEERRERSAAKPSGLERLGERVFVATPRMFSFTHRLATSIRHPHIPLTLLELDAEVARPKQRNVVSRAERLSDLLSDTTSDEERWKIVGRMLDSVLFETDISQRRQHALDNASLRRALETWWCKAGGTTTRGITEETYKSLHNALYNELLRVNDLCMHSIVTRAIHQDWLWDSEGSGEVPFGRWYISLLEIADNWVASCDGEAYGAFLQNLMDAIFVKPPKEHLSQSMSWEEKSVFLERNARTMHNPPYTTKQRTARHTVEYVRTEPLSKKQEDAAAGS